jgi:hypothetical protein
MRKALLLLPVLALGLAACGNKAKNEAALANESIGGDSNTMGEAVTDTNAALSASFNDAEGAYASGPGAGPEGADGNEVTD